MTPQDASALPADGAFVISRVFDAPRDLVWKVCSEPEHMGRWFGPVGCVGRVVKMDFRPGGMYHFCLTFPGGMEMWARFVYREIVPPEKIVYLHSFSDDKGGLARHSMSPVWPLEILSTFTFTELSGKTTLTINWMPYNASDEERKVFGASHGDMRQGWSGTLDRLAEYLMKSRA